MKITDLPINQICSAFDRAETVGITYSWCGSPQISVKIDSSVYAETLNDLEFKTINLIRNLQRAETPEVYIQTCHLVHKVSLLKERSQQEINQAKCISRLFYKIRDILIQLFVKCRIIYPPDDIEMFKYVYVSIPLDIVQQNGFIDRFPPDKTDSFNQEPLYTFDHALNIYQQLNQKRV